MRRARRVFRRVLGRQRVKTNAFCFRGPGGGVAPENRSRVVSSLPPLRAGTPVYPSLITGPPRPASVWNG